MTLLCRIKGHNNWIVQEFFFAQLQFVLHYTYSGVEMVTWRPSRFTAGK